MTEKKEHPQAKWLRAIADGETLQMQHEHCAEWKDLNLSVYGLGALMTGDRVFRIKPRTITIGKYEVAEPMREVPDRLTDYFSIAAGRISETYWNGSATDYSALASGMCWIKQEDAELAAKAISELLAGTQ